MKQLLNNGDDPCRSDKEVKQFMELFATDIGGLCIRFEDGRVCNVVRRDNGDVILITHIPFFEFKNEDELNEYLPKLNK